MACHPVVHLVAASTEACTLMVMIDVRHIITTHMRHWGRGKSRKRPRFGYGVPQLRLLPGRKATHPMLERLPIGFRVPSGCGWHHFLTGAATVVAALGPSSPTSGEIFAQPCLSVSHLVGRDSVLHLRTSVWRVAVEFIIKSLVCGCGDVPQRVFVSVGLVVIVRAKMVVKQLRDIL